jgi:hypothetical protein
MKTTILLLLISLSVIKLNAQNPDITGDTLLCPNTNGTAYVIDPIYDSYQWFYKYWFTSDDFVPIEGATESVFVYDWYTYDQALLKVLVTLDGQTYESDTLQIDSWAWLPIFFMTELGPGVTFDPVTETYILEEGASFSATINNPPYDTLTQWYRNGDSIPGADSSTLVISAEGTYWATAAPSFCPNSSSTTLPINVTMAVGVPVVDKGILMVYPNPTAENITIQTPQGADYTEYFIMDLSGRVLMNGKVTGKSTVISLDGLTKGHYLLRMQGKESSASGAFVVN